MLAGNLSRRSELKAQTRKDADGAGLRFLVHLLSVMNQNALASSSQPPNSEQDYEATQLLH